ncbi:MAG TPA: hypothetical protein VFL76_06185 [Edaphocola sp.]|nr:hypothetical protein [Edaphocola sp.]
MKLNITIFLLAAATLFLPGKSMAQSPTPNFHLDSKQERYTVSADLDNGGKLIIHFAKAGDWQNELTEITGMAARQYRYLADSFKDPISQKNLFLKIPKDRDLITLQYSENGQAPAHQMVYKSGQHFVLKTTMDTIIILKDGGKYKDPIYLSNDSAQYIRQVQYTYILKDISDIENIAAAPGKLNLINHRVDSVLQNGPIKKDVEKRLTITFNGQNDSNDIKVKPTYSPWEHYVFTMPVGIEILNGNLGASYDVGYGYVNEPDSRSSFFATFNLSGFLLPASTLNFHNFYGGIGIELGTADVSTGTLMKKYSIGLGYFMGKNKNSGNETILPNMYRLYINFPITKSLNIGMDAMSDFKLKASKRHPEETHGLFGLYLKYSIL